MPQLRAVHAKAQEKLLSQVTSGEAIPLLNHETPAWRKLKAELLKQGQEADKTSTAAHDRVNQSANFSIRLSIALALLGLRWWLWF